MKDVCPNCTKENAVLALLKEILAAHTAGAISAMPGNQKRGQYIIDTFQACLKAMAGVPVVMPDIQTYK